ncbi:MAG: hypothetical protein DRI01_06570 [Chloroflexi bacterium]|nr:MAG: hypothetical protein DRI01_06570 [Chloroflexota bacterium]
MMNPLLSLVKIAILTVAMLTISVSACSVPWSVSSVGKPSAIPDGSGGIIIAYQVNEGDGRTTYVQRLGPQGEILWGKKRIVLYSVPGRSEGGGMSARMMENDGNTIAVWAQNNSLWAQKMDSDGRFLWQADNIQLTSNGVYDFKVVSENMGGVIVAWTVGNPCNLFLQRIDGQGHLLWSNNPLAKGVHQYFALASDSAGNTFVIWEDKESNVYAQRLNSSGEPTWPANLLLSAISRPGTHMHGIISDGTGGAIAVWICGIRDEQRPYLVSSHELYAQRIDADGNILWQSAGVLICSSNTQTERTRWPIEPRLVGDGGGGAIIVWREAMSIYAQRMDADGNTLWLKGGVQVWKEERAQGSPTHNVVGDGDGGAIVVWCYTPAGKNVDKNAILHAQRVDGDGQMLWGDNGIPLSSASSYSFSPQISQDDSGGVIVVWAGGRSIHHSSNSFVQRVNAEGGLLLGEKGIRLNN